MPVPKSQPVTQQTRSKPETSPRYDFQKIKKAFDLIDVNKDGYLSKEEFAKMLKSQNESISDEEIEKMMKVVDENGDGKIQFEEFVKAFVK